MENRKYDVIVAGGGLSGVAAAVAAAREGRSVLLLEKYGFLGGMATNALVNPFMAYCSKYGEGEKFDWDKIANDGIFGEIIRRLKEKGALHSNRMTFHEEYLKWILDELTMEYGVTVLYHVFIFDVEMEGKNIRKIKAAGKEGVLVFEAERYVDATGDADLVALAGCPFSLGNEEGLVQPVTLCFNVGGVDTSVYAPVWGWYDGSYPADSNKCRDAVNEKYRQWKKEGKISSPLNEVSTYASCLPGVIHFNSTRICGVNPMDTLELSQAEMEGRKQMMELFEFMKQNVEGFSDSYLINSGVQIGVRESRRIQGDFVLNEKDILSCTKFEDSIARGTYCIDIHAMKKEDKGGGMTDIPYGDYYTIPYRALFPKKCQNLIIAGRPISSTQLAHGAHRVMPICTSVGEAAGIAAALACKNNVTFEDVDINLLHKRMDCVHALY